MQTISKHCWYLDLCLLQHVQSLLRSPVEQNCKHIDWELQTKSSCRQLSLHVQSEFNVKLPCARVVSSWATCYFFQWTSDLVERFEVIDRTEGEQKSCKNAKRVGKLQVVTADSPRELSSDGEPIANAFSTDKMGYEEAFALFRVSDDSINVVKDCFRRKQKH